MSLGAISKFCPCGRLGGGRRPLAYTHCCGRYIDDFAGTPAPDAESLMRSRYSAFVLERADSCWPRGTSAVARWRLSLIPA